MPKMEPEQPNEFETVVFSEHFLVRFVQRTRKKYHHVDACELASCMLCRNLEEQAKSELNRDHDNVVRMASKRFFASKEISKQEKNNLIGQMMMKSSRYLRHSNMTFVVSLNCPYPTVVTCYLNSYRKKFKRPNDWLTGNRKTR